MGKVIKLPTQLNLKEEFRRGSGIESCAVDGSVMMRVRDVEIWLSFEQASEFLEDLSDTTLDAFSQLRNEMEERNGRKD